MLGLMFESLSKAAEASLQMQREAFDRWVGLWPCAAAAPGPTAGPAPKVEKKGASFYEDVLTKQREALSAQFQAGLNHIEGAFCIAAGTIELWGKVMGTLQQPLLPEPAARTDEGMSLETLEQRALEGVRRGLPPDREVYDVQNRGRIDWSRFPMWAQPADPEAFEGGHEG